MAEGQAETKPEPGPRAALAKVSVGFWMTAGRGLSRVLRGHPT